MPPSQLVNLNSPTCTVKYCQTCSRFNSQSYNTNLYLQLIRSFSVIKQQQNKANNYRKMLLHNLLQDGNLSVNSLIYYPRDEYNRHRQLITVSVLLNHNSRILHSCPEAHCASTVNL